MLLKTDEHGAEEARVLFCVKRHIGAVVGDPDLRHTEITMATTFGRDLELESLEFVTLADRLRTDLGDRINFVEFLAGKSVDEMISLTVGDVVRYAATRLQEDGDVRVKGRIRG